MSIGCRVAGIVGWVTDALRRLFPNVGFATPS
jgi:hypothetical protein